MVTGFHEAGCRLRPKGLPNQAARFAVVLFIERPFPGNIWRTNSDKLDELSSRTVSHA